MGGWNRDPWRGLVMTAALAASLGGGARAQEPAAFPPSLQREPLLLWLERETDILPARVVAVTPQALTAVVSSFPAGPGQPPRVVIRAEAMSAETFARTGALSWHVSLSADCDKRLVRLGETTGYPQRNLLGERRVLRPAETAWRTPQKGTALEAALRAACDREFQGPFQMAAVKVADADAPPLELGAAPAPDAAAPPEAPAAPASPSAPVHAPPAPRPAPRLPAARSGGAMVAQVGAAPTEAEAHGLLAALSGPIGGRQTWVETAEVGGRTWRRAVVGGFADAAEAERFCAGLKAAGKACFVRRRG
jgi:hypothetical protein